MPDSRDIFDNGEVTIAYNQDLSGNVSISDGCDCVTLSGSAMRSFISQFLRCRAERRIRQLTDEQILERGE